MHAFVPEFHPVNLRRIIHVPSGTKVKYLFQSTNLEQKEFCIPIVALPRLNLLKRNQLQHFKYFYFKTDKVNNKIIMYKNIFFFFFLKKMHLWEKIVM